MELIKVGIIGCGGIANGKHMPSIKATKKAEIVGFCDLIEEKAVKACKEFGTENSKVYTDYKEMLKDDSIVAIYVCTPNRSHSFITVDALNAKKHVLCEKPMAINSQEAKKMLDAAKANEKILTIGYQNRYRQDSLYLKKSCESGDLGDIYLGKATAIRRRAVPTWGVFLNEYEQGGGPLIDIGTHALDLTLWTMDNYKPKYVAGTTYHKLNSQVESGNAWGPWDPEKFTVEDSAFGFVVMENGATIILESSWALNMRNPQEAITTLCGTDGGADMKDGLKFNFIKHGKQVIEDVDLNGGGVDYFDGNSGDEPQVMEQHIFLNAVMGKGEVVVKPQQAYVVTQILEGIYESAKSGEAYYFNK